MSAFDNAFKAYCSGQKDMDNKSMVKMFKDVGIIDKRFTTTDADLIFSKVCPKGQRRITVNDFKRALSLIADKKGVGSDEIEDIVAGSHGPVLHATKADDVKFADESNFTGAHRNVQHGRSGQGGPIVVPAGVNDRQKVECPYCGYKSIPQWMNDKAHCLKCDAVLKVRASCQEQGQDQAEQLKQKFKNLDKDGDGTLTFEEMASLLRKGGKFTDNELRMLFEGADKDGSGTVDFDEFVNFIHAPPRPESRARAGGKKR